MKHGGGFSDYDQVVAEVEANDGVEAATPFVYSQAMLRSTAGVSGAIIRGIDPSSAGRVIQNLDGIYFHEDAAAHAGGAQAKKAPGIVLGKELARNLGVLKGDPVYLVSFNGMISPIGHIPSMKRFQVTGFFESGMHEFDGSLAYIDLKDAQRILKMGNAVSGVEVRISDIYAAREISKEIEKRLGFPYWARNWMQMNRNLFSALKLEKTVMFIILTLIVLVAAFNIASTLIMMVMQKTRDIAILKAMGATNRSIRRIFVFKGMIIGAVGTGLGVCLGFILCTLLKHYKFIELPGDVYYITKLPVRLDMLDVGLIAVAALAICFVATLYPARQASRLDPVEAIRYG
jgi:lipoprotein-releasing system permease protein